MRPESGEVCEGRPLSRFSFFLINKKRIGQEGWTKPGSGLGEGSFQRKPGKSRRFKGGGKPNNQGNLPPGSEVY